MLYGAPMETEVNFFTPCGVLRYVTKHPETYSDVSEMKSGFTYCWLLLSPVVVQGSSEACLVAAVVW